MWQIKIKKRVIKKVNELPDNIRSLFVALVNDLQITGPVQTSWNNYSKLSSTEYHCHLTYRYVACWKIISENQMELEVYYVGTRENAPY